MRSWLTGSEEETRALGARLARELAPRGTLLLHGDLGAGKTVLAQGVGEALGIAAAEIQSPSFTLVREHRGEGGELIHVDLYRLAPGEASRLGLDELLEREAIKVIEWAERLPFPVPRALKLRLSRRSEHGRRIEEVE